MLRQVAIVVCLVYVVSAYKNVQLQYTDDPLADLVKKLHTEMNDKLDKLNNEWNEKLQRIQETMVSCVNIPKNNNTSDGVGLPKMNKTATTALTPVDHGVSALAILPEDDSASAVTELPTGKACRKGMAPVQPEAPYPYPVIHPSEEDPLSVSYLCDSITDGGGWIIIQRRTTGDVDFYRGWNEYKEGFGTLDNDFWIGNDFIHNITSQGVYELRVELKYQGESAFAHYETFSIADEQSNYALSVGSYRGTAGDDLTFHNGKPFSTKDRDNDLSPGNCAMRYIGAWWYRMCHFSNLNGKWNEGDDKGPRWGKFSGSEPVSYSEMKIRRVDE